MPWHTQGRQAFIKRSENWVKGIQAAAFKGKHMVLHNPSHVIAQSKNENGLCARSYKKVKAQKLVKLLCQSTFSQLAKCFHDFLTDHNLLYVIGFFCSKEARKV